MGAAVNLPAQDADASAIVQPDSIAVPSGKVIPVNGAFLTPLQERDSVLIADQLLYGFELKGVREGTRFIFPELPQEQDYRLMYLSPWIVDTLKVSRARKGEPKLFDIKASVLMTSFEEGVYDLPQIALQRLSTDGVTDTLIFDPMRLDVRTMPVDTATFVPHDIKGLTKLMGGKRGFINSLQGVFDNDYYDPANEPDIVYAYLFSRFKGEEWRTQKEVKKILDNHYKNAPDGIPGNDDTGTMSAWAVFSMMGIYPDCPGEPYYTITTPRFERVEIDTEHGTITIATEGEGKYIRRDGVMLGGKPTNRFRLSHDELIRAKELRLKLY